MITEKNNSYNNPKLILLIIQQTGIKTALPIVTVSKFAIFSLLYMTFFTISFPDSKFKSIAKNSANTVLMEQALYDIYGINKIFTIILKVADIIVFLNK